MPGLGQALTAVSDAHHVGVPIGFGLGQSCAQMLHPALLLKPFRLRRISFWLARFSAHLAIFRGEHVSGRLGQPFLDGGDRRPQPDDVPILRITRQPALIVVRADDRVGPPSTRLRREPALAIVEPLTASLMAACLIQARGTRLRTAHRS
jgi:hypothetical protein